MSITTTTAPSMKLMIDQKAQRVLFAEASKDAVDFLFSLLAVPLASAVKVIGNNAGVGNLYASVEKLDSTYGAQTGASKGGALLFPTVFSSPVKTSYFYTCDNTANRIHYDTNCSGFVTDEYCKLCPNPYCGHYMSRLVQYLPSSAGASGGSGRVSAAKGFVQGMAKGFVQGNVTYMVQDDLTVTPMSAVNRISLLNTFAVRDIGDIQEKTVQLGYNEGLAILKAWVESKSVLTDVFLHGNKV